MWMGEVLGSCPAYPAGDGTRCSGAWQTASTLLPSGVAHEGAVVAGVVFGPGAGPVEHLGTGDDCCLEESPHSRPAGRREPDVRITEPPMPACQHPNRCPRPPAARQAPPHVHQGSDESFPLRSTARSAVTSHIAAPAAASPDAATTV